MTKELRQRAEEFFKEHHGVVANKMFYLEFNDIEIDELRQEGLLEHVLYDEWHWKAPA